MVAQISGLENEIAMLKQAPEFVQSSTQGAMLASTVTDRNDQIQALKKKLNVSESNEFQLWKKNKDLEAELQVLRLATQYKKEV